MKKINSLKLITCSLVLVALMSATAFATVGQPSANNGELTTLTTTNEKEKKEESNAKNMLVSGKVTSIVKNKDYETITITNDNMGMVFHVMPSVFIIDQKTSTYKEISDIKEGMTITAILNKLSPMTMSLPPQTGGAIGFVINSENGCINLSTFNKELVNFENTLKLNISDKTHIVNSRGEKKIFTEEDLKGSECLVLYGISTRSIPAQTNPEFVMILNSQKQLADNDGEKGTYVFLRESAEAKGYQIKWESSKKPIVLTKDDITVQLTIGSTDFQFKHLTKDIKPLDRMEKLDGAVKFENGKTKVPKSFADAL